MFIHHLRRVLRRCKGFHLSNLIDKHVSKLGLPPDNLELIEKLTYFAVKKLVGNADRDLPMDVVSLTVVSSGNEQALDMLVPVSPRKGSSCNY
ncbi:LIM domain-containing protein WLIM2b-like [Iris pallida]|uniref:LIM domain-containing protein WLIM2b-like n=1 Tax=Iris pallida TaxID=29817 RepID=A0AAX6E4P1_IRIPA|nr:LIM domain-containing protein WLIM2b-like [Iris pallida]